MLCVVLTVVSIFAQAVFAAEQPFDVSKSSPSKSFATEIYAESQYDHRFDSVQTNYRVELISKKYVPGMYLGVFQAFDDETSSRVDYDEYFSLKIGWKRKIFNYFGVFTEYRRLLYSPDLSYNKKEDDFRIGLYGYWNKELHDLVFFETYGEAVYSSRLYDDTFFAGYLRFFNTLLNKEKLQVGPYAELFIKRDIKGFFYENLEEGRYGLRGVYRRSNYSIALNVFGVSGHYTDREYRDPNPYSSNYDDFRTLLVFYGEI